jgi:hypothetical protein
MEGADPVTQPAVNSNLGDVAVQVADDTAAAARRFMAANHLAAAVYADDLTRITRQVEARLNGEPAPPARAETRVVAERGVTRGGVWIPYSILDELTDQAPFDSELGAAYIRPDRAQERALIAHGLAVKETRGGLHRGDRLAAFIRDLEFP